MGKRGIRPGDPLATCFIPKGRRSYTIYAVSLKEHVGVVKIGRTTNWNSRKRSYEGWNLASGDAIRDFRTFTITEPYVDLNRLEAEILAEAPFTIRMRKEWFYGDLDEVCKYIESFLDRVGLSYL